MAVFKLSMIIDYVSGGAGPAWFKIPGGFSESVYYGDISTSTINSFKDLIAARCFLLPTGAKITGYRLQAVDPRGSSSLRKIAGAGPTGENYNSDIPQMALLLSVPASGLANTSRRRIAAIPDRMIRFGEYDPTTAFRASMTFYLRALNGWWMRGHDLTQTIANITTVAADGTVTITAGVGYAINDVISIRSTQRPDGTRVSGQFKVAVATSPTVFQLKGWKAGACVLGTCQKIVSIFPPMATASVDQDAFTVVTRKIGRPLRKYVGRRSKRRR